MDIATLFQPLQATLNGAITAVLPIGIGIFGTVMAVNIGIKMFKKTTKG